MEFKYRDIRRQARPRNGALLDVARGYAAGGGSGGALGGEPGPQYWRLVTADAEGQPLEPEHYYIISQYHVASEGGISAYGFNPNLPEPPEGGWGGGLANFVISGSGNALTTGNYTDGTLTLIKGEAFATIAQLNSHMGNATIHLTPTDRAHWDEAYNAMRFWTLVTTDADGMPLNPEQHYIISQYHVASEGGMSAYGFSPDRVQGGGGGGLANFVISGSGNALTTGNYADGTLTLIRGETFATIAQLNSHAGSATIHLTSTDRANWNAAYTALHSHINKIVLDGITAARVTEWDTAYNQTHIHSNKALLDVINQNLSTAGSPTFASYIQLGSVRLQHDSANNALKVVAADGSAAHLYATGGVSAYGFGSAGGGGGTAWGDITGKPAWIGEVKPTYTWTEIAGKPAGLVTTVTIAGTGNAVTNATFSSGALTLTKSNLSSGGITAITGQNTGSGNAVTSVTGTSGSTVVGTMGWMMNALSLSGSGNVITAATFGSGTLTLTRGNVAGGGAVASMRQYYGSSLSLNTTVTTGGVIRTGFLNGLSGTLASGTQTDVGVCWDVTSSNCLGAAATIQRLSSNDVGGITASWRWQSGGMQFTVHNRSGSSLSLNTIGVSFVAICAS